MDQVEVLKNIIETRRSIFPKSYSTDEIDENVLEEILNSANFAPNHKRTKPWRLKIFRGEEKNQLGITLANIYQQTVNSQSFLEKKFLDITDKVAKSNAIITISVNFSGLLPEWEEIAATAMAVQNMYLTATAHEIGCYWSTPGMINHLGEFLGLEENQKCIGLFYLGKV
ncbi:MULTISPECIES: nitroreductase [unclassified Kaistella]|uniref:nitroreductase family protein n=1 Tax=unclassified Kaistella TaxID=2762626 RepID=UPI00273689C1|nr:MULTISPECIES: nitroreductase [unclassified Kaistella]MDP2453714.1 nitroreductase [Kaistella sp. SH11-4b]MDP2456771.1 nitroreductase [Kaistella sp. SH40-3]MDP2459527.1 nitroreductase [Kaistella sp. SH19-2b]